MLSRHLFYTAVTRAQQLCVVIGSYRAIAMATKRVAERQRYTRLQQRLQPQAQPAEVSSAGG
jgi:ATP-dependent exoDNAse (exonuclease V) alpha subunit